MVDPDPSNERLCVPHHSNSMPASQPPSKPTHEAPIPEGLSKQLEQFKKRLWSIKVAEAILAGCFGLLFSFLLVFGLDRFIETPASLRLIILIGGVSLFALFSPYWIHRWVYGHRRENQIARLISRRFPKLGDRLLGAIELQDQDEQTESLSPELRAAAMRTVAADAARRDLTEALPAARHRKWSIIVILLFLTSVAALISVPEAGVNALMRWLMPLASTERYTFTRLDLSAIDTPHRIPYGEAFSLTIPLAEDTHRRPANARARYGTDEWVKAALVNGAYTFDFPGQRAQDNLVIEADDAHHTLPIEPVMRPALENIRVAISLPDYLERADTNADLRSGFITILEGSRLKIRATTTRKLSSASAEIITLPSEINELNEPDTSSAEASPGNPSDSPPADSKKAGIPSPRTLKLTIEGKQITTPDISIAANPLIIPIEWRDIHGLGAGSPLKIRIEPTKDQAPSTYIQGVARQHIMLAEETIEFEVLAEDDYGLKACGISWQGAFTRPTSDSPAMGELTVEKGGPSRMILKKPFSFSPANLSIEPQKIELRSWTEDYKPGRSRIYSEPITIYILTRDEHAQVLKNEFDKVIGELEDVARKEQNLNDENERIERKWGDKLQSEQAREKLMAQQEGELANQQRTQELTERMEKLFKDAVRNGEIDKQALKKMSEALQAMKELSKNDLPQIEKKLEQSQSKRNTPEKSKQDLKDAIEKQEKAIEKMKQAIKDANDANQNFEASTFVNRLKRAAREQDNIASSFVNIIDQVIGCNYNDLDPVEQRSITASHAQQRQTSADVRWIQEDLAHYYARTQKPEHKELVETMRASNIGSSLEELAPRIAANLSYTSIDQSKHWAEQLRDWAKKLKGDQGGGGGGGGGGGMSQEEQDFEFMLKVMRMIQKEQDIRARTRALEDLRRALKPESKNPNP